MIKRFFYLAAIFCLASCSSNNQSQEKSIKESSVVVSDSVLNQDQELTEYGLTFFNEHDPNKPTTEFDEDIFLTGGDGDDADVYQEENYNVDNGFFNSGKYTAKCIINNKVLTGKLQKAILDACDIQYDNSMLSDSSVFKTSEFISNVKKFAEKSKHSIKTPFYIIGLHFGTIESGIENYDKKAESVNNAIEGLEGLTGFINEKLMDCGDETMGMNLQEVGQASISIKNLFNECMKQKVDSRDRFGKLIDKLDSIDQKMSSF